MLASEKLKKIYGEKAKQGLVDVKFAFVDTARGASFEQLCEEVLAMENAISDGKSKPLNFGDLRIKLAE